MCICISIQIYNYMNKFASPNPLGKGVWINSGISPPPDPPPRATDQETKK